MTGTAEESSMAEFIDIPDSSYTSPAIDPRGFQDVPEDDTDFPSPWFPGHQVDIPGSPSGNPELVASYPQANVPASSGWSGPGLGLGPGNLNQTYDQHAVPHSAHAVPHSAHVHPFSFHSFVHGNPGMSPVLTLGNQGAMPVVWQNSTVPGGGNVNYNPEPVSDFDRRHSASSLESVQHSLMSVPGARQSVSEYYASGQPPQLSGDKMPIPRLNKSARSSPERSRRRYVEQACERCRKKKRKCTGQETGCDSCTEQKHLDTSLDELTNQADTDEVGYDFGYWMRATWQLERLSLIGLLLMGLLILREGVGWREGAVR
ncbi:hypothetical protein P168DRAFT_278677 [Aspergillus campestris IBT 28561]|uniref:Zn(2)-C6 fungal-type domain-containing protein n=1 Tax=Aspergillus campestris (strain IBT 28561) TaxID=1392248 RepID=A0A2I1DH18_ASPC2|nr:uncharacterized protein P168DRAFT_278677 [Aspergillus campestris IBT 28561]PKY09172.1 hypothetical protein P168DRAFT_278677 [Aspergillus campestris IBT 28561]